MGFEAFGWSVVIVGRWNTAIFTPGRISNKIFCLGNDKGVEVKIPIDGLSLYQVKHPEQNIIVAPGDTRLQITLSQQAYKEMEFAMAAGVNAINWLPETPFSAAGFNISYRNTDPNPAMLAYLDQASVDNPLATTGEILTRSTTRKLSFGAAEVNIAISGNADLLEISFNFNRTSSNKDELIEWLTTSIGTIKECVEGVMGKLDFDIEEDAQ